jgi:hypothetical protein
VDITHSGHRIPHWTDRAVIAQVISDYLDTVRPTVVVAGPCPIIMATSARGTDLCLAFHDDYSPNGASTDRADDSLMGARTPVILACDAGDQPAQSLAYELAQRFAYLPEYCQWLPGSPRDLIELLYLPQPNSRSPIGSILDVP